ncbi:Fanconi anemia group D2 protein [Podila epicladia]|nr:Fanconi anemia group D2 protein [Podila epicladia]
MKLAQCFQDLAGYVKSNDKKDVLSVTLKHSKTFMEQFIKRVIPFLGVHFKGHQDPVARIFRHHLQPATRSLQNVCSHAKASKEQILMSMVPSIKKTMEFLIFQVKLMLETNDARVAFWVGNLKHRNLAGEEISSQLPVESEDEPEPEPEVRASDDDNDPMAQGSHKRKGKGREGYTARKTTRFTPPPGPSKGKKRSGVTKSTSAKSAAASKKRKSSKMAQGEDDERIHTKSQISNSDMSEDEQDQLEGEEQEVEDVYDDHAIEEQEERAERHRRVRNPYIDDAAMSGDDEEDEEDEEGDEDEDDDEEEDEEMEED